MEYLNYKGIAKVLGVSVQTCYGLVKDGMPVAFRIKNSPRFEQDKCIEWFKERSDENY